MTLLTELKDSSYRTPYFRPRTHTRTRTQPSGTRTRYWSRRDHRH